MSGRSGKTKNQNIIHEARQVKTFPCKPRGNARPLVPSNDTSTVRDRRHKSRKNVCHDLFA